MRQSDSCTKCNSKNIIPHVRVIDRGHGNAESNLELVVYENPQAMFFKGAHKAELFAQVCGECGYTEMYVSNPQMLYAVYREAIESGKIVVLGLK